MFFGLTNLFHGAGATGHVFLLNGGKTANKGLAYSGLIGPMTTVAVVPTTPQTINFAIEAQTKDKQTITVQGSLPVTLIPEIAVSKFDFTVDVSSGGYTGKWLEELKAKVLERVLRAVLDKVKELEVEEATRSQKAVEDAVIAALGPTVFAQDGITIGSCSIPKIVPRDSEVLGAIGAQERQTMLTGADKALHDRRIKSVENDRTVREYEAGTLLELEKKNGLLIDEQNTNKGNEAKGDAAATKTRLAALDDADAGKLLGAALMKMAENDKITNISIVPELMAALGK